MCHNDGKLKNKTPSDIHTHDFDLRKPTNLQSARNERLKNKAAARRACCFCLCADTTVKLRKGHPRILYTHDLDLGGKPTDLQLTMRAAGLTQNCSTTLPRSQPRRRGGGGGPKDRAESVQKVDTTRNDRHDEKRRRPGPACTSFVHHAWHTTVKSHPAKAAVRPPSPPTIICTEDAAHRSRPTRGPAPATRSPLQLYSHSNTDPDPEPGLYHQNLLLVPKDPRQGVYHTYVDVARLPDEALERSKTHRWASLLAGRRVVVTQK